jgi:hypothetical protein
MPNCVECNGTKARLDRFRDIYLCSTCKGLEKYKLIYKTHIKDQYDIKIENYNFQFYEQPYGKWPTRFLYRLSDVHDVFCQIHNIDRQDAQAIEAKRQEITEEKLQLRIDRSQQRQQNKIINSEKRRTKLIKALEEFGLELRPDSRLCSGYINGTIKDWNIKRIVRRMCQMKYLYEYCNMEACYQELYNEDDDEYFYNDNYRERILERAEALALSRVGGYPDQWPWLNQQLTN